MKKLFSLFLFLTFLFIQLNSQSLFHLSYGGTDDDCAYRALIRNGDIITFGREDHMDDSLLFFGKKMFINRFDGNGNAIASKTAGYLLQEYGYNFIGTMDGGYLFVGEGKYCISGNCGTDGFAVKTDSNLTFQWSAAYGGLITDDLKDAVSLTGGGYMLMGNTASFGNGNYDIMLVRINNSGDTLWTKTYGSQSTPTMAQETGYDMLEIAGNFYVAGQLYRESDNSFNPWIFKVDGSGNLVWAKTYVFGTSVQAIYGIQEVSDGIVAITDSRIFKIDFNGNFVWGKLLPSGVNTRGAQWNWGDISVANDGGFFVSGLYQNDAIIIKTDASGNFLWAKKYGKTGLGEFAASVDQMPDGRIVICGYSTDSNYVRNSELWVTDASGNLANCSNPVTGSNTSVTATVADPTIVIKYGLDRKITGGSVWNVPVGDYSQVAECQGMVGRIDELSETGTIPYVYPNPFNSDFTLMIHSESENVFEIYDTKGSVVFSGKTSGTQTRVNLNGINPGLYFIRIENRMVKLLKQ